MLDGLVEAYDLHTIGYVWCYTSPYDLEVVEAVSEFHVDTIFFKMIPVLKPHLIPF